LSQKELQRVSVISACIKGDMACARAAGLLCLSVRQIKRLKKRMREDGEAALAHANRGRPSHRRLQNRSGISESRRDARGSGSQGWRKPTLSDILRCTHSVCAQAPQKQDQVYE